MVKPKFATYNGVFVAAVAESGQTLRPQKPAPFGACGFESHPPHVTRPGEDVARVRRLATFGFNNSEVARLTGVSRAAIRDWLRPDSKRLATPTCPVLGMYLGDGTVARMPRCFVLRVFMDSRYPDIISEVAETMRVVMPKSLASVYPHSRHNVVTIASYSKAWGCLLPSMVQAGSTSARSSSCPGRRRSSSASRNSSSEASSTRTVVG
jgi:hypothetical protein